MKFYKNKKTKYHPSLELSSNDKTWRNMAVTHHPIKKRRYIELHDSINPNDKGKSYVDKHIRNDPIQTRGQLLKKYRLTERDLKLIEEF